MNTHNRNSKYSRREELKQQIKRDKGWYFIAFVGNLPPNRPYGFTLYKKSFVLLRNNSGELSCYLLPTKNEKNTDNICVTSFTVIEKQGRIWLWHSRNVEADPYEDSYYKRL